MKTETVCTEWLSHAIQKYDFLQEHKKNMYWPILKKIIQLLYSLLYMEKNINIYMYTSVVAIAVPIQKCRDVFYI